MSESDRAETIVRAEVRLVYMPSRVDYEIFLGLCADIDTLSSEGPPPTHVRCGAAELTMADVSRMVRAFCVFCAFRATFGISGV